MSGGRDVDKVRCEIRQCWLCFATALVEVETDTPHPCSCGMSDLRHGWLGEKFMPRHMRKGFTYTPIYDDGQLIDYERNPKGRIAPGEASPSIEDTP